MSDTNIMLERLLIVYGDPDSHDPKAYMAEVARLMSKYSDTTLHDATDHLLATHRGRMWPTPAQCINACQDVLERDATRQPTQGHKFPSRRGPYSPETLERWRLAKEWRDSLPPDHPLVKQGNAHEHAMKPVFKALFEAMQRNSPNQHLHGKEPAPLTNISRRMSGDTQ